MRRPTLFAHGPAEVFHGRPALYRWLLDHPDRAVHMWHRLGAHCLDIHDQGGGRFGWSDGQGTVCHWDTVVRSPDCRVWYAEGNARPAPLLPNLPFRAVVILRYSEDHDRGGRSLIRHQADVYLQTDSKTAALVTRLLGPSAPRLAQQGLAQLEMFFSALVWYVDRHPEAAQYLTGRLPAASQALSLSAVLPGLPRY
jgi:hypothetical protein